MTTPDAIASVPALATAVGHHQAGRIAEAEAIYRQVLRTDPGNTDALHLLGVVQLQCGRPQDAIELISQSLAGQPENQHALNHLGEAFRASGFLDEARTCFERTLALNAEYFQAANNLGNVYQMSGRLDVAMSWFERALAINSDYAEAHTNLGNARQEFGQWNAAIASYERALTLRPDLPEASFNLANLYKSLRQFNEAILGYQKVITLKPSWAEAHLALGHSFYETGERELAAQCFRRVIELQPENAEARWALVMTELGLIADDHRSVQGHRAAFTRGLQELERWFDAERIRTAFGVIGSQQPFYLAYQEENNRALLAQYGALCHRIAAPWQDDHRLVPRSYKRGKRVRAGLVSAHVCDHPVWNALINGWCKNFDPRRIDLYIYYLGKGADRETQLAQACASKFVHGLVRPQQWAEAILADRVDVLIYPEIGMDSMAVKLAALRLAPVQATTWGHPETSGLPTMDYYISAADFEPADAQQNYTEKLITLPNLGCCYEPPEIAREELTLRDFGLGGGEPLFICPGTPFKYAPQHDWVYPAIARRLGRCRFAFFKYAPENLSRRLMQRLESSFAQAHLMFEDHIVQLPWLSKGQFASLMRQADVYLDTIGFSGFNTVMQAIEAGLPVVTREGRFLRGRLASGVLRRMGMIEFIAESEQHYVNLVTALGQDRRFRGEVRDGIERSRSALYRELTTVTVLEQFLITVARS